MVKWKKYNGAIVPDGPPHIEPTAEDIEQAKKLGKYRFITYTTAFDCNTETPWWYIIKDTPIILENIKSGSKRYKINKGLRYVNIKKIDCKEYAEELYNCYLRALERYKAYESSVAKEDFLAALQTDTSEYYGAFFVETGELVAYVKNEVYDDCVAMSVIKYNPDFLKYQISAALTYKVVNDYINNQHYRYVMDGQRSIRHKTNIQDYLEDYFEFRKAYCKLNIIYSPAMNILVKLLYPFRKCIEKLAGNHVFLNNVSSVLKMEEIRRCCKRIMS